MVMEAYMSGLAAHPKRSLAGKFFTTEVLPSFDRTECTLRQQWKLSGSLKVVPLENNIILFEFEEERDKKKVVEDGPWNVDGIIFVVKECPQDISRAGIDFSTACFWVKVIGLPCFNHTKEDAEKIGKKLSDKPVLFEYTSTRCFWLKAEINLKKPLPPGFYIGRGRRRPFVQFKYKNLGEFCEHCGMISHRKCGEVAKMRPLTREFKTHVYGPWLRLRYDHELVGNGLPVKPRYFELCNDMGLEYEETLTYAQLLVKVKVDVICASEHEWGGKKLIRSLLISEYDHRFRFPCSPTRVMKDVLAVEVDKISPLARLTADDKASIVHGLDYIMNQKETWSKRRWVPLLVRVEKTIMVPPVDMETMLQEAKDNKLLDTINTKIFEMAVARSLEKPDDLLMRTIRGAICELGVTQFPDNYVETLGSWVKEFNFLSRVPKLRMHPNHKCVTVLGPDMDLFGTCCICQEDFFLGREATLTSPCSHVFHTHCIEDWIQQSQTCPLCRLQLRC